MENVGNGLHEGAGWQQYVGSPTGKGPAHLRCPTYCHHDGNVPDKDSSKCGEGLLNEPMTIALLPLNLNSCTPAFGAS